MANKQTNSSAGGRGGSGDTAIRHKQEAAVTRAGGAEPIEQATYYTPLVDIAETGEAFLFQADLPGVTHGDVDISYENGNLTVQAKARPRQPQGTNYAWREYGVGHFYRSFSIDVPVNPDGIKAELKDGVLSLYVPKAESAKTRRIEIKAS
jgi:HSP20 family protein